jgi:hypothetical protein
MQAKALALARQGLPVFPCRCNDKRPLTVNGFKEATTEAVKIKEWWTNWPRAHIGVPTGHKFVVVDLDLQHEAARAWYEEARDQLPLTRTHLTKSGGRHLLFRPNTAIGCSTSKLGPHVDTRGAGGYIIWWPACGLEVLHTDVLAPVPEWVVGALSPPPNVIAFPAWKASSANGSARAQGIVAAVARAREGQRNSLLYWGLRTIRDMLETRELDDADGRRALEDLFQASLRTGLLQDEIQRTVNSAMKASP